MSSTLLTRFQGPAGYYNGMASPFADSFLQYSYDGTPFHYLAALYPVIELEYVSAYRTRKRSEHFVSLIQRQKRQTYPAITQWRYSRRFDFAEETQNRSGSYTTQCYLQGMQSSRGLFEYSCGDLDTVSLDLQQTSLVEEKHFGSNDSCVLQIDSMWLLMFVKSSIVFI